MGTDDLFKKRKKTKVAKREIIGKVRWLITCEGEKTEPQYFEVMNKFYSKKLKQKMPVRFEVHGLGANTVDLVNKTLEIKNNSSNLFQKIFVVFDKDSFKDNQFQEAIDKCKKNGFIPIWSNECFEIWYLLHFSYHQSSLSRSSYSDKLTKNLGFKYEKNNPKMFEVLKDKLKDAYTNSSKLTKIHENVTPSNSNPHTKMHLFIDEFVNILKENSNIEFWKI